jgi:hypothetical protein
MCALACLHAKVTPAPTALGVAVVVAAAAAVGRGQRWLIRVLEGPTTSIVRCVLRPLRASDGSVAQCGGPLLPTATDERDDMDEAPRIQWRRRWWPCGEPRPLGKPRPLLEPWPAGWWRRRWAPASAVHHADGPNVRPAILHQRRHEANDVDAAPGGGRGAANLQPHCKRNAAG